MADSPLTVKSDRTLARPRTLDILNAMSEARRAHEDLEARRTVGKLLLIP